MNKLIKILILTVAVLMIGGAVYFFANKKIEAPIKNVEATNNALAITYVNDKYRFSLNLPPEWKDYRVGEEITKYSEVVHFGVADQDDIFSIVMLTSAQYAEYLKGDLQSGIYLAKNDLYTYLLSHAQDETDVVISLGADETIPRESFRLIK